MISRAEWLCFAPPELGFIRGRAAEEWGPSLNARQCTLKEGPAGWQCPSVGDPPIVCLDFGTDVLGSVRTKAQCSPYSLRASHETRGWGAEKRRNRPEPAQAGEVSACTGSGLGPQSEKPTGTTPRREEAGPGGGPVLCPSFPPD